MNKKFYLILFLTALLGMVSLAWAAVITVGASGYDHTTIQAAITAANPSGGDVIEVYDGIYGPDTITINKLLTVRAATGQAPIIDGGGSGKVVVITANGVTFQGFTVRNSGTDDNGLGIQLPYVNNCTVKNNIITNCKYGIWLRGTTGRVIDNNNISYCSGPSPSSGIMTDVSNNNISVTNNDISFSYNGYYSQMEMTATSILLDSNTIHHNTNYGLFCFYSSGFTFTRNDVHNNGTGVYALPMSSSNFVANYNKIHDNTIKDMTNASTVSTVLVDARHNWWNADDPSTVISGNVNYDPWYSNEGMTILGSNLPVANTTQGTFYSTIQAAVNAAGSGNVIEVAAGTYTEAVTINQRVILQGAGEASIISSGAGFGFMPNVGGASDTERLIIKDFKITGSTYGIHISQVEIAHITFQNLNIDGCSSTALQIQGTGTLPNPLQPAIVNDLIIENCKLNNSVSEMGMCVDKYSSVYNLTINNSQLNGNRRGFYSQRYQDTVHGFTSISGVSITNTQFNNNRERAIYLEKLDNAVFDNIKVIGNGYNSDPWFTGLELNLKFSDYENIMIKNSEIANNGLGNTQGYGTGLNIKARDDGATYGATPASLAGLTIINNDIYGNQRGIGIGEYGVASNSVSSITINDNQIYNNTVYGMYNALTGVIDATLNYWGDASGPLHPTLNPEGSGNAVSDNVLFDPWYSNVGMTILDSNLPVANTTQGVFYSTIQAAIDEAIEDDVIELSAGPFDEALNIEGKTGITIQRAGYTREETIIKPSTTLAWNTLGYTTNRRAAIRIVNSTNIAISGITLDCDLIKNSGYTGVLYANSTGGVFAGNTYKNMSTSPSYVSDVMFYGRALEPDYTIIDKATLTISNNHFIDTGRIGLVTHNNLHSIISGNDFSKTNDCFGYAMEIGSTSTAVISNNEIWGFDTPAYLQDQSSSGGIYIENAFTSSQFGGPFNCAKPVTIENNEIYGCSEGIIVGNQFNNYAGNVDIVMNIIGNNLHGNIDYGILITDEDKANGSSVTATITNNAITSTLGTLDAIGIIVYAIGDGDLNVTLTGNNVSGYDYALFVYDWGTPPSGSSFTLSAQGNTFSDAECGVYNGDVNWAILRLDNPLYVGNTFEDNTIHMDLSSGPELDMSAILANNTFNGGAYEFDQIVYSSSAEMLYVDAPNELIKDVEPQFYSVKALSIEDLRGFTVQLQIPKADFNQPDIDNDFYLGAAYAPYGANAQLMPIEFDNSNETNYLYTVTGTYFDGVDGITATNAEILKVWLTSKLDRDNTSAGCWINLPLDEVVLIDEMNQYIGAIATAGFNVIIDSGEPTMIHNNAGAYPSGYLLPVAGDGSGLLVRPTLDLTFNDNYNLNNTRYLIQPVGDAPVLGDFATALFTVDGESTNDVWQLTDMVGGVDVLDALVDGTYTVYFLVQDDADNYRISGWNFVKDTAATEPIVWEPDWTADVAPCRTTPNANNSINLMWTNPVGAYKNHIWALSYSTLCGTTPAYPEYPTTTNAVPAAPNPYNGDDQNGWTRVGIIDAAGAYTWSGMPRDYYYITVFAADAAGNISSTPAATFYRESISYWPGDVNNTPDGLVTSADIALLSPVWGQTPGNNIMDIGPSVGRARRGRPIPDNRINIEDLMMFSLNYDNTNYTAYERDNEIPEINPIRIEMYSQSIGDQLIVSLNLGDNAGFVKGLNIPIQYGSSLTLQSVVSGDVWPENSLIMNTNINNVVELSGSTLGQDVLVEGNGNIATLTFSVNGTDTALELQHMIARTIINTDIDIVDNPLAPSPNDDPVNVIPAASFLGANYPNPFNPSTTIQFGLNQPGQIKITIFNTRGQIVKNLVNEVRLAGIHNVVWNGKDNKNQPVSSGVYFYRMETNNFSKTMKSILLK